MKLPKLSIQASIIIAALLIFAAILIYILSNRYYVNDSFIVDKFNGDVKLLRDKAKE